MRKLLVLLLGFSTACASTGPLEQEIARLRQEMRSLKTQLKSARDKIERVEDRMTLLAKTPSAPAPPARRVVKDAPAPKSQSFGGSMPALPVVRLSPSEEGAPPDDGGAPIMIKLGPDPGPDRLVVDHEVLKKPDPVLDDASKKRRAAPVPVDQPKSYKERYREALSVLREQHKPGEAREMFKAFRTKFPRSSLSDNAQYWLGECSFVEGHYESAIDEFSRVVSDYPKSNKVPHALLRMGQSWYKLGDSRQAVGLLKRVAKDHTDAEAVLEANKLLEKISSGEKS